MKNILRTRFGWLAGLCLLATHSTQAAPVTGPSTSQVPYVEPMVTGVEYTSILTTGDSVGGYRMAGIPDGMGAFDNGDGTYTVLMNHEIGDTLGVNRAHGGKGAFVSRWVIDKVTQQVISGQDLMTNVYLFNTGTLSYNLTPGVNFNRFCSADLPAVSAYYNSASGLGTQNRLYMNGEEGNNDRAMAHVVNGPDAGKSFELPYFGHAPWENILANPYPQNKTIVAGMEDSAVNDSQVYFYIGTKQSTGSDVAKAGLLGGKLYGVKVNGLTVEVAGTTEVVRTFTLFAQGNNGNVLGLSAADLQANGATNGVTAFQRVEDGAWNPNNPREFYFATTASVTLPSRLWRLTFTDITQPELGGTIEMMLNGTEGQIMIDNLCIDAQGNVVITEDPGGNNRLSRIWKYYPATDGFIALGQSKPTYFTTGQPNFITIDEEHSGVIDMTEILGAGKYLYATQVHSGTPVAGPNQTELVEGGQLALMTLKGSAPSFITEPTSAVKSSGQPASFSVIVSGGAQIQWYKNGVPIIGATSATYNIPATGAADAGQYVAVLTAPNGSLASTTVNLTVTDIVAPSTTQVPYVEPLVPQVQFTSILTAGDSVGGYRMVGVPDGMGAFDNGDGTYTLLVNHELAPTVGINRAHGGKGAFVSRWVINKTTQQVLSGQDLMTNVFLFNTNTLVFEQTAGVSFQRFCSADLPAVSAYYNSNTGKGTQNRIFMDGEEGVPYRAMAHVVTGPDAGKSYHLAYMGRLSWENLLANPYMQDQTIVAGSDDDGTTDSQVVFYVGNKQTTGNEVEKAGLVGGTLYGLSVSGMAVETAGTTEGIKNFTLVNLNNVTNVLQASFDGLEQVATNAGVSSFQRVEDGAWNPNNPREFYFATTASVTLPSRLWRLTFTDITQPTLGGTIEMVLNGTEGQIMMDNICFDAQGNIVITEDPGGNNRLSRIWKYYPATDGFIALGQSKPAYFTTGQPNFITIDEEHSGVIDMTSILGAGKYLYATQVHSGTPVAGPNQTELAEGGQLALMTISGDAPTLSVQPTSVNVGNGQSATFSVTASAGAQIQWYKNGVPIFGATGSTYNIPAAGTSEAAQYTAVVTDVNGSVASTTVVLTLTDIAVYAGLVIAGPVNQEYQIQYATSLQEPVTWTNLESITLTQSPLLYIDQSSPGQAKRFYRALPVTDR